MDMGLSPEAFIQLLAVVDDGTINQNTGKEVLAEMLASGKTAEAIIAEKGLKQVSDGSLITTLVAKAIEDNPGEVKSYLAGKETVANWLFGQVMRAAQGKANPQVVKEELNRQLEGLKH